MTEYLNSDWVGTLELAADIETYKVITMNEMDINLQGETEKKHLSLSVHVDRSQSMDLYIFSPYWVINKTGLPQGLPIQLRVSGKHREKFLLVVHCSSRIN